MTGWRSQLTRLYSILVSAAWICSCGGLSPPQVPAFDPVAQPNVQDVESVVFLYGDAGAVRDDNSPLLVRLRKDIEHWSAALDADSSVLVVALGDNVYPSGVAAPNTQGYPADTAVVMSQVRLVAGPHARERGARAYFVAGNHDWNRDEDREGLAQLKHFEHLIDAVRARDGVNVRLVPAAGTGGPHVVDWGRSFRILLLDTAWWILQASDAAQDSMLSRIDSAVATRGDRAIMIGSHHAFISGGTHGGHIAPHPTAAIHYLLSKSGTILEDITSRPYRRLDQGLRNTFERHEPPLIFAGGHDHSLQVITGVRPTDPTVSLVSGAASKLDDVRNERGMRFARSAPGYMRVIIEKSGGVTAFVESADPAYLECPGNETERVQCMTEGAAAFRTVYSQRVR